VFRQYRFERTVRFILVTGEEQGVWGSAVYATSVAPAGNVLWVLDLDMLGWDGNKDGEIELHTRTTSTPGYSNDLQIAAAFTNVIADCGLGSILKPVILADGNNASDHRYFWANGIPAAMAIEDWSSDHTPYYHQAADALSTLNWTYFATYCRAAVGALAKLAVPTDRTAFDMIEVASVPAATGTGVGAGVWYAAHADGAGEAGGDPVDVGWTNAPPNPYAKWLKILSDPYGDELRSDARPPESETVFFGRLIAVDTNGATGVSTTNRLRFDFVSPAATNRTYLARVHVDGQYAADSNAFHCVTNLRTLAASGRYLPLPALRQVSNGVEYGTCEIAGRFLFPVSSNCVLDGLSMNASQAVCRAAAPCGARICDVVEANTNLIDPDGWTVVAAFTNDVPPDESGFDSGWTSAARPIDAERLTNSPSFFFRLKRSLLDW